MITNTELIAAYTESGFILDTDVTKDKQYYLNNKLLSDYGEEPYKALLYFGFDDKSPHMSQSLAFLHGIASFFVERLAKNPDIEITRSAESLTIDEADSILQKTPYAIGAEFVDQKWVMNMWANLTRAFESELAIFSGAVAQFLLTHNNHINIAGRVFFHLVETRGKDECPFAFLATYSRKSSDQNKAEHVPLRAALREYKDDQELLLQLLGAVSRAAERSDFISELVESGELFSPLRFTTEEAYVFLKEIPLYESCGIMCRMPDWWKKKYNAIKVSVSIGEKPPSQLGLDALLSFTPTLTIDGEEITRDELERLISQTAGLSLLKGKWVEVDHEKLREVLEAYDRFGGLTDEVTFAEAIHLQMGLANTESGKVADDIVEMTNGQWLSGVMDSLRAHGKRQRIVAGDDFKATLRHYQQDGLDWLASMKGLGFGALLADDMGLGKTVQVIALLEYLRLDGESKSRSNAKLSAKTESISQTNSTPNAKTESKLRTVSDLNLRLIAGSSAGSDVKTDLSAQMDSGSGSKTGLSAGSKTKSDLSPQTDSGAGSSAGSDAKTDLSPQTDSGKGSNAKTNLSAQSDSETGARTKTLLIIPASLIGNWQREIDRFAPKLRYSILHAKNTAIKLDDADVFITTYGMASRLDELKEYSWDIVILDEAQAIKNPGTKQTKAIKVIPSRFNIALTGTPVENRLSDLWSLFDFLNMGLLGTSKEFSNYAKSIQGDESYARLRRVISPFIMRRLKTDKSIIKDLPDKVEMKAYATLSKKQVVLYSALVKDLEESLETVDGIERKGVVLAGIMKFKQICNHPDHYLGQKAFDQAHSGKFHLLAELCETIRDKRERTLVFTQFREMCEPLSDYLETLFGKKGLILHGGTPVNKRSELVERFNGDEYVPFMVLSLKAGGVGLNLTAANHVIHFDRWWNPAVENQATDRAFRIGQKKNVLVHKMITAGTIEEKIDKMIEDKLRLSSDLIAKSGENWITEMSSKELVNLFTLDTEAK
ncbi:MAG: SNF2-related protein [Oscillospiraceae bacterium]|nr:SNF2-related protein [Oscillospiraceae bacterium]